MRIKALPTKPNRISSFIKDNLYFRGLGGYSDIAVYMHSGFHKVRPCVIWTGLKSDTDYCYCVARDGRAN